MPSKRKKASKRARLPPKVSHEHKECYIHGYSANTKCRKCGRDICSWDTKLTEYPHVCPSCFPKYMKKKKDTYKSRRKKVLIALALINVGLFLLMAIAGTVLDSKDALKVEDPDPVDRPVARVYLDTNQIYPKLGEGSYSYVTNKVYIEFKVYITNRFHDDLNDVKIELMVLKNDTIRESTFQRQNVLKSNESMAKWLGVRIDPGEYYAHFVLWQEGKVIQKATIYFGVNKDDVQETTPPPPPSPGDDDVADDDDDDDDDDEKGYGPSMDILEADDSAVMGVSFLPICFILLIILLVIIIVAAYLMSKKVSRDKQQAKTVRELKRQQQQ